MGAERVSVVNLRVMKVDAEKGVLLVKGAVPGYASGVFFVRETIKSERRRIWKRRFIL